jgi:HEAT repeat protein
MGQITSAEMTKTIADFLELGHVENIVALFKQEPDYYTLTGDILNDERFMVRMGMVVLFEELAAVKPQDVQRAIPSLLSVLGEEFPAYVRGEALTILGVIGGAEAIKQLQKHVNDPDPQVAEIARDYLQEIPVRE